MSIDFRASSNTWRPYETTKRHPLGRTRTKSVPVYFLHVGKELARQVPKKKVRGVELVDAPYVWVEQVFLFFSFSGADEEIWDCSRFLPWTQNPPRVFMEVDPSFFMEKVEANPLSSFSGWVLVSVRQTKGREEKGEIRYLGSLSNDAPSS